VTPDYLWWGTAATGALITGLFLAARRPVALRLGRLSWLIGLAVVGRLVLIATGHPLTEGWDWMLTGAALLAAIGLRLAASVWLVRAEAGDLRRQIEEACRRLFLACEEPQPGRFRLTAHSETQELRLAPVSRRLQLVRLPRSAARGKIALLVEWLSKQYPGPLPRLRRVLKERPS
jgi:hypothetical protein